MQGCEDGSLGTPVRRGEAGRMGLVAMFTRGKISPVCSHAAVVAVAPSFSLPHTSLCATSLSSTSSSSAFALDDATVRPRRLCKPTRPSPSSFSVHCGRRAAGTSEGCTASKASSTVLAPFMLGLCLAVDVATSRRALESLARSVQKSSASWPRRSPRRIRATPPIRSMSTSSSGRPVVRPRLVRRMEVISS